MKILFTICGRAGSKGIKNKNIRSFLDKPLPFYTLSALDILLEKNRMNIECDVVINSDSDELLYMMKNNPFMRVDVIKRDSNLAGGSVGKIEVITDCLVKMEKQKNCQYDMVVDLDITSPLRTVNDIESVIEKQSRTKADVTTTITEARRNPYFNQLMQGNCGYKKVINSMYTARQQAPTVYDMNASIYAYKPEFLKSKKSLFDGYMECVEMYDTGILDLDHENDFELMEVVAKYLFDKKEDFRKIYTNIREM